MDQSGAVISAAKVTATQTNTSFSRSIVTGVDGEYALPNLPVGPYQIEVVANGFKAHEQTGIVLQVNNDISVKVALEFGSVGETIQVSGNATMVQTRDTPISQVIEQQRIADLPLDGRDPSELVLLSGVAVLAPSSNVIESSKNYPTSYTYLVAGGQANGTYHAMDGADHMDPFGDIGDSKFCGCGEG